MPSINDTINAAMQASGMGRYRDQATPVVQALIEREQRIFTGIVEAGTAAGLSRQNVASMLARLDMSAPPEMTAGLSAVSSPVQDMNAATAAQPPFGTDPTAVDDEPDLLQRVEQLERFARQYGFNS